MVRKRKRVISAPGLPKPECRMGYTRAQIETIMGERKDEFFRWMDGQTIGMCDAREYDHEHKRYKASGCAKAHGAAYYPHDVRRFLEGRPIID